MSDICGFGTCPSCGYEYRSSRDMMAHKCDGPPGLRLPGPVPIEVARDGAKRSGYVWPTWAEALRDAQGGIERAYDQRRRVMQAAYDEGLSLKQIAEAVGLSPAAIHKIIGRQRDGKLNDPAFGARADS